MLENRTLTVVSFYLTSLICGLTIVYFYQIPTDPKNIWLWGLSSTRLLWMMGMFILGVFFYIAGQHVARVEKWTVAAGGWITRRIQDGHSLVAAILALLAVFILAGYLYYLTLNNAFGDYQVPMVRLTPFFLWIATVCLQYCVILGIAARRLLKWGGVDLGRVSWWKAFIGVCLVGSIWALAAFSGLGLEPDVTAWGAAGTPLLFWQVLAGCGLALLLIWICLAFPHFLSWKYSTIAVFVFLWLATAGLWLATPLKPNYYALAPVPPNAEYYPYSDAAVHDLISQNLLIGEGLGGGGGKVVRRPLYALFLAGIHTLAGQDYERCASLQVIVLAFFPALVFLLGSLLHSRLTGFLAAVFLIIQEHNAILLSGVINVSHSKLFMSDLPSALLVALFTLLAAAWFRLGGRGWKLPLCLGGVLGALMLIRPQAILLAVGPVFLLVFSAWRRPLIWLKGCLLFGLGLTLCVSPWLWRNWRLSGGLVFDEPSDAQIGLIAQRYTFDPALRTEFTQFKEGESYSQYSARMSRQIVEFALTYPAEVASFVSSHFMHNLVNGAAIFPLSAQDLSLEGSVRQRTFWLDNEDREQPVRPTFPDLWMLGLNLAMLGVGIASLWGRRRDDLLAGLVPLLTYICYNASNALARNSGWRFMQPADWIAWLLFSAGVSQIILRFLAIFPWDGFSQISLPLRMGGTPLPPGRYAATRIQAILLPALIFLLGASLPISEGVIQRRYPHLNDSELLQRIEQFPLDARQQSDLDVMRRLITDDEVKILWGRALYPRFYKAGQGIKEGTPSPLTRVRDYARLTFELIGSQNERVVLVSPRPPQSFINGSDVYAIGCYGSDAFYPYLVIVVDPLQPGRIGFYPQGEVRSSLCL
jgi:hypothetical protein